MTELAEVAEGGRQTEPAGRNWLNSSMKVSNGRDLKPSLLIMQPRDPVIVTCWEKRE